MPLTKHHSMKTGEDYPAMTSVVIPMYVAQIVAAYNNGSRDQQAQLERILKANGFVRDGRRAEVLPIVKGLHG